MSFVENKLDLVSNTQHTTSCKLGHSMQLPMLLLASLAAAVIGLHADPAVAAGPALQLAAGPQVDQPNAKSQHDHSKDDDADDDKEDDKEASPEEKMRARFPQPIRVGDLIGLPVLDEDDSTIGYVQQVVRTPEGKTRLIVPYGRWLGWLRPGRFSWGKRPVAVPIEAVVILARQLDILDMGREDFDEAPTWEPTSGQTVPPDEKTLIGLGRR